MILVPASNIILLADTCPISPSLVTTFWCLGQQWAWLKTESSFQTSLKTAINMWPCPLQWDVSGSYRMSFLGKILKKDKGDSHIFPFCSFLLPSVRMHTWYLELQLPSHAHKDETTLVMMAEKEDLRVTVLLCNNYHLNSLHGALESFLQVSHSLRD